MKIKLSAVIFLLSFTSIPADAQRALKSPREFFGFEMGADRKLANWPEILQYFQELAESSDRVDLAQLGKTTLGKSFIALVVSAPENLQRLEHYKSVQTRLSDPRGLTPGEADRLIAEGKSIVMITCNIHSTEIASSQTAIEFIYRLATLADPQTTAILKDTILFFVPSLNPDGQQMVVEWYRKYVGTPHEASPLPELYHHYVGHDNNRDWYMFTQVETQHTISKLHNVWHPQIVYDVHQMGASAARIFVPPWMDPVDPNIDPILQQMTLVVGTSMATDLTAAGRKGVVMNAMYDLWTPSRHYQNYHGGIRILTESASVRIASPVTVKFDQLDAGRGYDARRPSWNFPEPWPGGEWRLRDIVDDQLIAFRSCLAAAARDRERLLRNFYLVGKKAVERKDLYAFVIPARQKDPVATAKMLGILRFGMVEIHQAKSAFTAGGKAYGPGAYIIPLAQPYGSWAKTLLERQDYPDLREYPGGPPKRPYDVTAHTLPLLMGVDVDLIPKPFECSMVKTDRISPPAGRVDGSPGQFGYVISHDTTQSSLALNRIFKRGFKAAWLTQPIELGGRSFAAGNIYVPQADDLDGFMAKLASEAHLLFYAADRNVGGSGLRLDPPRIGLYKSYVPSMDEGWTRWLLEQYEFPYRSLYDRDLRGGALRAKLDAIVIPDQNTEAIVQGHRRGSENGAMPDEYTGGIGEEGVKAIRDFVEQGGTLITLNKAAEFAIRALQLPVRNALEKAGSRDFYCPGSLLRVEVDNTSPLAFGMNAQEPAWVEGGVAFEANDPSIRSPLRYASKDLLMSGWLLGADLIHGKPVVLEVPKGKGKAILLGFRPQYRGQSYATFPLLFNALYYSAAKPADMSSGR
jgi:Zinc carboxypeptidase